MTEFKVDITQVAALARDLRKFSPELLKDLYGGLEAAGQIVASDARRRAAAGSGSTAGSTRIPGSIGVRRRRTKVRVVAGGAKAPHAAPLDNRGAGGKFRHPIFGGATTPKWVDQDAVPFLEPAGEAMLNAVESRIVRAVNDVLQRIGL